MAQDLVQEASEGSVVVVRAGEEFEAPGDMFYAPATMSLIRYSPENSKSLFSLVDTGGFGEGAKIRKLLGEREVIPRDIGQVVITHNHPDHLGNVHLFEDAEIVMPDSRFMIFRHNLFTLMPTHLYEAPGNNIPTPGLFPKVSLIATPGHSGWDLSVLYTGTSARILMCGDLFWSERDWKTDSEFMGLCVNPDMQRKSRDYVRGTLQPEVVVPGHGPAFAPNYH